MLKNKRVALSEEIGQDSLATFFNFLRIPPVFPVVRINIREIFNHIQQQFVTCFCDPAECLFVSLHSWQSRKQPFHHRHFMPGGSKLDRHSLQAMNPSLEAQHIRNSFIELSQSWIEKIV